MSDAEKQARLAEALRANLRKRKAQARAIDGAKTPGSGTPDSGGLSRPSSEDEGGEALRSGRTCP
jgi:hypothetical protein